MASMAPNLTIKLNLDAAGLNKGFNAVKGATTGLSKNIKDASKNVSGLDHALEGLGVPGGMKGLEKHMEDLKKDTSNAEKEVKSLKQKLSGGWKAGLSGVRSGLKGMGKDADNAGSKVDGLKNRLGGVWRISGGIILFNIIRKITRALKDFISTIFDFDTAMHNVNSVAQLTDTQFDALNSQVLKLALDPRIKDGPAQLAAGLYEVVSAGYSAAEGLQLLQVGAIAATAGMTTTETATGVLIATLGAYNLGVDHTQEISDKLFQIVNISKYTFEDLAAALDSVTPTAAALGISIDEVGAAMATMGAKGVDAQTATVQMNAILTALLKPTDAMSAKLLEMGYSSGVAMLKQEGFTKTMQIWNDVLDGSEDKAAEYFGDVRALRGLFNLTNDDVVALTKNLKLMGEATDGVGATQKALTEQMKASSFQADVFKKNLQIIGIMVLSGLLPYLNKALLFVNSFIVNMITQFDHFRALGLSKWLSFKLALFKVLESIFGTKNAQMVNNFITKLEGYFNTLKDIATLVWNILKPVLEFMLHHMNIIGPAIIGAVVALKLLAGALVVVEVVAAVLAFELTPVIAIMLAVAATGALLAVAWYNNWGDIQGKTHAVVNFIMKWLGKLHDAIQPVIDIIVLLGTYWKDVFNHKIEPKNLAKLPKWLQPFALVLGRVAKALRVFIVTWQKFGALAALKTIPVQLRAIGRALEKLFKTEGLAHFGEKINAIFHDIASIFGGVVDLIDDLVHGRWDKIWGDLVQIVKGWYKLLYDQLTLIPSLVRDAFSWDWGSFVNGVIDLGTIAVTAAFSWASDFWDWLRIKLGMWSLEHNDDGTWTVKAQGGLVDVGIALVQVGFDTASALWTEFWDWLRLKLGMRAIVWSPDGTHWRATASGGLVDVGIALVKLGFHWDMPEALKWPLKVIEAINNADTSGIGNAIGHRISEAINNPITIALIMADFLLLGQSVVGAIAKGIQDASWSTVAFAIVIALPLAIGASAFLIAGLLLKKGLELAAGIVGGIAEGLGIKMPDIVTDIVGWFEKAVQAVKDFLGISSPSTVFEGIGENIVAGLRNGLAKISEVFQPITDAINTLLKTVKTVSDTISDPIGAIKSAFDGLNKIVDDILEPIRTAVDKVKSSIDLLGQVIGNIPIIGGGGDKPKDDGKLSIGDIINAESAMNSAVGEIQKNRALITTEFQLLREDITYTQNKFIELPGTVATQMVQTYMNVHTNILGMETRLGNLWDKLKDVGTKGGEDFNTNLSNGLQMATTSNDLFMDAMEIRAGEFVTNMGAFATSAGDAFNTNLSMGMQKATTSEDLYMDAMEIRAGNFVSNMGAFGTSAGNNFGYNLSNALYSASSGMYSAGQSIMNSLWSGMASIWLQITYWLSGLDPAAYKGPPARDKTLLLNAGKLIMGGLGDGLDQGWQDIKRQLSGYTPFITSNAAMPSASLPLPVGPQSNGPRVRGGRGDLYLTVKVEGNVYGVEDMTEAVSKEMGPVLAETWRDVRKSLGVPA